MAPTVAAVTQWKPQAAPMAWRNGRIYYHRTGTGVVAEGYSCLPDGSDERLETGSTVYPAGTHQSIEDVSPDGRYALVTVERANHWPNADGYSGAAPGAGTYNDLWLLDLQTGSTWKLVDLLVTKNVALIWPRFNKDGTKVCWTELVTVHWFDLGAWSLFVADVRWSNGAPSLANRKSYKGQGFIEAYGFSDDGSVLAAVSLPGMSVWCPQICRFTVGTTIGAPARLSPKTPDEGWPWANYCEFAYEMPAFPGLLMFGRTFQAKNGSIEFWTMPTGGGAATRLTYFCEPADQFFQAPQVMLGGVAWDPDNPLRFVAGYATDYNNTTNAVVVELAA